MLLVFSLPTKFLFDYLIIMIVNTTAKSEFQKKGIKRVQNGVSVYNPNFKWGESEI